MSQEGKAPGLGVNIRKSTYNMAHLLYMSYNLTLPFLLMIFYIINYCANTSLKFLELGNTVKKKKVLPIFQSCLSHPCYMLNICF